jgi:hypothetical protein
MRVLLLIVTAGVSAALLFGQAAHVSDLKDPVSLLAKQIESGEAKLSYDSNRWGYLSDLLNHLDINIDSQILMFSKTSFQLSKIGPKTRARFTSMTASP